MNMNRIPQNNPHPTFGHPLPKGANSRSDGAEGRGEGSRVREIITGIFGAVAAWVSIILLYGAWDILGGR